MEKAVSKALLGIAELNKKLNDLADPKENGKVLRQSVGAAMRVVMKEARTRIPVGTQEHKTYKGRLVGPGFASRSLRVSTSFREGVASARLGVRREAFYAVQFIELGTSKIPRQPWLVPSLEAKQDEAVYALADAMRKRIEKIAKRGGT